MKKASKTLSLLRKYLWWVKTNKALSYVPQKKIVTYVLNFGDYKDIRRLLPTFSKKDIREAIVSPLHGVWDKKSLNFWRLYFKKK